jgi:hypothetical protein
MLERFPQRAAQLFARSRGFADTLTRSITNVSAFKTERRIRESFLHFDGARKSFKCVGR